MNVARLLDLLDRIKTVMPEQNIIVGGQGPTNCQLKSLSKYEGIQYISNLEELENYIDCFKQCNK